MVHQIAKFHERAFPDYGATPLLSLDSLATRHGARKILIKDESSRFGLPAFKILGASWAICSVLCDRWNLDIERQDLETLRARGQAEHPSVCLYAATDGNHGRAVARVARLLGLRAKIWVPEDVVEASRAAIASEGAEVTRLLDQYDAAVRTAANSAADDLACGIFVQDTSFEGYTDIPSRIVDGYSTLFAEVDDEVDRLCLPSPTVVIVPVGVGSLAHAAVRHYYKDELYSKSKPKIIAVEPSTAACLGTSLAAGHRIEIRTGPTIMPGLCCGTVSMAAWPDLKRYMHSAVRVTDAEVQEAMHHTSRLLEAGPCGAATVAALNHIELSAEDTILLVSTESSGIYDNRASSNV